MAASPASSTAAAAEAPCGTVTVCPSTSTALFAAAEHDRAFLRLAQAAERHGPDAAGAFGDKDLAALRADRRRQPEQRRQLGIAQPGGQHDLRRGDRLAAEFEAEIMRRGLGL